MAFPKSVINKIISFNVRAKTMNEHELFVFAFYRKKPRCV